MPLLLAEPDTELLSTAEDYPQGHRCRRFVDWIPAVGLGVLALLMALQIAHHEGKKTGRQQIWEQAVRNGHAMKHEGGPWEPRYTWNSQNFHYEYIPLRMELEACWSQHSGWTWTQAKSIEPRHVTFP